MKKIKLLGTRTLDSNSRTSVEAEKADDFTLPDTGESVSEESVRIKPTKLSTDGFTSWIRKIRPTSNGMESEVEKPLIIAQSGHRIKEEEIKGQCEICGGYDSFIFNCSVAGCKKSLCLKHVYFFEDGKKKTPYCLDHYKRAVDEYDTWNEREKGRK